MSGTATHGPTSDLDALEAFLNSERVPESAMDISTLDGFLTAIAVGPELIMPSEWMPFVWGHDEPVYDGLEEAQRILHAIMGRYNEIVTTLRDQPQNYGPLFYEDTDGSTIAECWAEGFVTAIRLRPAAWQPILEDEKHASLVVPILLTGCADEISDELDIDEDAKNHLVREAADYIPACVFAIDEFWRERGLSRPARSRERKVGRNEPCPCGSGRKYKRCCGAGTHLH